MKKKIAILLNGAINNDYRVIKTIETLSKVHFVDLYYINGNSEIDQLIFNNQVTLKNLIHTVNFKVKVLRHSLFCFEYNFFHDEVLKSNIQYDIIWANDLPTLYPAFRLSKNLGARLIFDSHEIYTETINQFFPRKSTGIKKGLFSILINLMRWHGKRIERKIFPSIDVFITVNQSLLEYFHNKHSIKKGVIIMNVPKLHNIPKMEVVDYFRLFSWVPSSRIMIYHGNLNEGRGLQFLTQTVKILPDDYKLIIIGNGPLKVSLINEVKIHALDDRIKFIDTVPLNELPNYTSGAHVGINLLESFNLSKQLASPNKLFEYIHAEIPVLASDTVENRKVLERFKIGILTSNDPLDLAKNIKLLFYESMDRFSLELSYAKEFYTWEKQEEILLLIIE